MMTIKMFMSSLCFLPCFLRNGDRNKSETTTATLTAFETPHSIFPERSDFTSASNFLGL